MLTSSAVNQFLSSCKARNLSKETIKWYRIILEKFSNIYLELPFNQEACEHFLDNCSAGDERRHGYYRALRALYRYGERRHGWKNPIKGMDPPQRSRKLPRPVHPPDVARIWAQDMDREVRAAIHFLVDTGCRLGECHSLDKQDLLETPWGNAAMVNGKTGQRIVPISPETYKELLEVLPFKYSKDWLCRKISAVFKSAGVHGAAHALRHTFGTYWEGEIDVLKNIMGHTTISTTMIYRGLRMDMMAKQHRLFSPARTMLSSLDVY